MNGKHYRSRMVSFSRTRPSQVNVLETLHMLGGGYGPLIKVAHRSKLARYWNISINKLSTRYVPGSEGFQGIWRHWHAPKCNGPVPWTKQRISQWLNIFGLCAFDQIKLGCIPWGPSRSSTSWPARPARSPWCRYRRRRRRRRRKRWRKRRRRWWWQRPGKLGSYQACSPNRSALWTEPVNKHTIGPR